MLRLIQCEFLKLKRKRLFQAAFLTTFIMPVLYSLLLSDSSFDDLMSVIREENGFLLLIPLTVVLAANLFFEEHDYDTLKREGLPWQSCLCFLFLTLPMKLPDI